MRDRTSKLESLSKTHDVPILGAYFKTRSDNEVQLPVIPTECNYSKNYYVLHIELENKVTKEIEDFLDFPIMPQQIELTSEFMTTVTKTQGSTVVISNSSYMPTIMTISGTFGDKNVVDTYGVIPDNIAIGSSGNPIDAISVTLDKYYRDSNATTGQSETVPLTMTGYAILKYFDALLEKHRKSDLYNLNVFNLTFDQQMTVMPIKKDFSITADKNGLWFYSVTFQSVKDSTSQTDVKGDYELALSQRMEAKRQAVEEYNKNIAKGIVKNYAFSIATSLTLNSINEIGNFAKENSSPKFVSSVKSVQNYL
jgi:hypothetical protein